MNGTVPAVKNPFEVDDFFKHSSVHSGGSSKSEKHVKRSTRLPEKTVWKLMILHFTLPV